MRVTIVVLGDLGNSPRMQYHALALATTLAEVDLIGYAGSPLRQRAAAHPHIRVHRLRAPRRLEPHVPRALFVARAAWRVAVLWVRLLWLLIAARRADVVLVQNPPAIPTLLVALVAVRLRSAKLIIDWHNFGYAMLALRLGPEHLVVRAARRYERFAGRLADGHLCVSRAMQSELAERWGIRAAVCYDRPAEAPGPTPLAVRRDLFARLRDLVGGDGDAYHPDAVNRPGLIVSPTSWTADEDFTVLLDALERREEMLRSAESGSSRFPALLVLITGQGPLRAAFDAEVRQRTFGRSSVRTLWVAPDDYPLLLGAADLGLCLHRSASGVDLPMKIADMFGAGLPVCALDYGPCLAEQVRHGENGLLFTDAAQLAAQLFELFRGFPGDTALLARLRRNVAEPPRPLWSDEWSATVRSLFTRDG
jgi:beta-1,4-mannosyltransferase